MDFLEIITFIVFHTCSIGGYYGEYAGKCIKSMFRTLHSSMKMSHDEQCYFLKSLLLVFFMINSCCSLLSEKNSNNISF